MLNYARLHIIRGPALTINRPDPFQWHQMKTQLIYARQEQHQPTVKMNMAEIANQTDLEKIPNTNETLLIAS